MKDIEQLLIKLIISKEFDLYSITNISKKDLYNITNILKRYDRQVLQEKINNILDELYKDSDEIRIPVSIFSDKLSPFESVVKFLAENKGLSYTKIGILLNRDRQVIWITCKRAQEKDSSGLKIDSSGLSIPLSELSSDKFTVFELVVRFLKEEEKMSLSDIGRALHKDRRTIWTTYARYNEKNEKE